jgi:bla regulator protein blaR1
MKRSSVSLLPWKRLLFAAAPVVAVAAPVVIGVLNAPLFQARPRAHAQAPGAGRPSFEIASVKPNTSRDGQPGGNLTPGGRFTFENATVRDLVALAYQLQDGSLRHESQISGGPSWINLDRFNISAKADIPAGVDANRPVGATRRTDVAGIDQVRLMVRTLLADRFKLTMHDEIRDLPVYALVTARNDGRPGPQLRKVEVDCAALYDGGRRPAPPEPGRAACGAFRGLGTSRITGHAVTMLMLASLVVRGSVGRIVLDRTDLSGAFDLDLEWTPGKGSSIFTALQEQLGLKLDSRREPVDVLTIDHVERPTED